MMMMLTILDELIRVAKMKANHGTVLTGTSIDPDDFVALQEELAQLIVDVANTIPGGPEHLAGEYPEVFRSRT